MQSETRPAYFDDLHLRILEKPVQENHYDPWGVNLVGIESEGNPTHRFQFNGKEKITDLDLQLNDHGARLFSLYEGPGWWAVDPLAELYPEESPYVFGHNNPMRFNDPDGRSPDDHIFNERGEYVRTDKRNAPDRVVIENSKSGAVQNVFALNDPLNDGKTIGKGDINKVVFASEITIEGHISASGARTTSESAVVFIERESHPGGDQSLLSGKSNGNLDFINKGIIDGEALYVPTTKAGASSTAYNAFDFGNFLWGRAGQALGFRLTTLMLGGHANNALNGRREGWDQSNNTLLDSPGDQRAIANGYVFPKTVQGLPFKKTNGKR